MKNHSDKCATRKIPNIAAGHTIPRQCDCDSYHTFDELYDHRITLWIAYCKLAHQFEEIGNASRKKKVFSSVWRSKNHSDGEPAFGGTWFVLGLSKSQGLQITYHIPIARWDETDFAETLDKAPEWDGHSSDDVLERLKML